jgi:hypothetical protein
MSKHKRFAIFIVCLVLVGFTACAAAKSSKKPYEVTPKGTVVYAGEFEFTPPPPGWKLFWPEGEGEAEFAFGFMRSGGGPFPSQSVFAYDEEPFGSSRDLQERADEFFKRFLWNAMLRFQTLEKKTVQVLGREGLEVIVEGKDPVKKEKAKSKVIFFKRGERVVAFYITQWRPIDAAYDPSAFEAFDKFVASFRYLKKSFYETL